MRLLPSLCHCHHHHQRQNHHYHIHLSTVVCGFTTKSASRKTITSETTEWRRQQHRFFFIHQKNNHSKKNAAGTNSACSCCSGWLPSFPTTRRNHCHLHRFSSPSRTMLQLPTLRRTFASSSSSRDGHDDNAKNNNGKLKTGQEYHQEFQEQLLELQSEREALFGFTDEEKNAWSRNLSKSSLSGSDLMDVANDHSDISSEQLQDYQHHQDFLNAIEEARQIQDSERSRPQPSKSASQSPPLTHISDDGTSIHMVDVGSKVATQRMARAQSKVLFPPVVAEALASYQNQNHNETDEDELIGPKGPIFATAKVAGIMAAKKTSDLIPLCHPLPLDKVQIDIQLEKNEPNSKSMIAIITCECRVTHKTGVEMEALVGATAAALTIYDMVKAVSHQVEIVETKLITKTGGKRTVGIETETGPQ